jgi:hypothetical protein
MMTLYYAKCHKKSKMLCIVMVIVILLSVIMLSVILLSVMMLNVIMQSVIMLSIIMLYAKCHGNDQKQTFRIPPLRLTRSKYYSKSLHSW